MHTASVNSVSFTVQILIYTTTTEDGRVGQPLLPLSGYVTVAHYSVDIMPHITTAEQVLQTHENEASRQISSGRSVMTLFSPESTA